MDRRHVARSDVALCNSMIVIALSRTVVWGFWEIRVVG